MLELHHQQIHSGGGGGGGGDQGLVQDNGARSDSERLCFGMYGGVQE